MSTETAKAALLLFESVLNVPPNERAGWIERTCGGDEQLAAEVHALLAAHCDARDFLVLPQTTERPAIAPGQQLGDFIIEQQIGAGGMGLVFRARQLSLNRLVALKVLPPQLCFSESARLRFQREVEAVARLRHPNIVAVYTTGEDGDVAYYAMELIDGPVLNQLIEELRRRPLPEVASCQSVAAPTAHSGESTHSRAGDLTPAPPAAPATAPIDLSGLTAGRGYFNVVAQLMADVAIGLDYAHQMHVIHRDVKPSNLLLTRDGHIHVSDFGIARITEEPGLTRTGAILGTPFYMAPEQISAAVGSTDERTDIYAIGATLYELLTLRPPVSGDNRQQVMSSILHQEPIPPRTLNRAVPRDLETICLKALEKDPARRYASARELADDLQRFMARRPVQAKRAGVVARGIRWVERHRAWAAAVTGIAVLALVVLVLAYRTHVAETRWTDARFGELFETAQLAAIEGNLQRAGKAIHDAEELGAPPTQLALLRGQLALQSGEFQDACDVLEKAVLEMPQSLAAHALLMNAYRANEQHEKRAQVASRLPGLKLETLQDYLLLGQAQAHSDAAAAQSTLDKAVQRYKTSVVARLIRGGALVMTAMDTADPTRAEFALDDLRIASELLDPNALLLSRMVEARLTAATAYAVAGDAVRRQQHLEEAASAVEALKAFPDHFQSHTWRAFYFDYIGDDRQAIEAWRAMTDHIIGYLVLALYRRGEFQEGITLCEERMAKYPHGRFSEFLRAFVLAAHATEPETVTAAFTHPTPEPLDPRYEHCFKYAIYCLTGDLESGKKFSRDLRGSTPPMPDSDERWRHALDYTCGELSEDELLERLASSRVESCKSQFFIGLTHLAAGDRDRARLHFRAASDLKVIAVLHEHLSRAVLAQLDRDPTWPPWIPLR